MSTLTITILLAITIILLITQIAISKSRFYIRSRDGNGKFTKEVKYYYLIFNNRIRTKFVNFIFTSIVVIILIIICSSLYL